MTKQRPPNQWQPGQTGNPKGRPPGQSEITRLRAAIAEHVPLVLEQLVTAAKGGDVQAARLILERVLPPLKGIEQAVALQWPADSTTALAYYQTNAEGDRLMTPSALNETKPA